MLRAAVGRADRFVKLELLKKRLKSKFRLSFPIDFRDLRKNIKLFYEKGFFFASPFVLFLWK